MQPPIKPNDEDCCYNGCSPCIFDVYDKQMSIYLQHQDGKDISVTSNIKNSITETTYTEFTLTKLTHLCGNHILMKFRLKNEGYLFWNAGDHFVIRNYLGESKLNRAYTPIICEILPGNENLAYDKNEFVIFVKKYDNGFMSNYLFSLSVGDSTWWRGPYNVCKIDTNQYSRIFMVAQGTGIAPMISIINQVLKNENDYTQLILFYCCKDEKSILLRNELYSLQSFYNFSYKIFLNISYNVVTKYKEPILCSKLDSSYLKSNVFTIKDQVLICGSNEFMKCFKESFINIGVNDKSIVIF